MIGYIQPEDIAHRIFTHHRYSYMGLKGLGANIPKWYIFGKEGEFGRIVFDFGIYKIEYRVYLKDKKYIRKIINRMIDDFALLMDAMMYEHTMKG
jgi:hypothetical protein